MSVSKHLKPLHKSLTQAMSLLAQTLNTCFKQECEAGRPQNQQLQLQAHSGHMGIKGPTSSPQGQPPPRLPSHAPGTTTGLPPAPQRPQPPQGPSTITAPQPTGAHHYHSPPPIASTRVDKHHSPSPPSLQPPQGPPPPPPPPPTAT